MVSLSYKTYVSKFRHLSICVFNDILLIVSLEILPLASNIPEYIQSICLFNKDKYLSYACQIFINNIYIYQQH